MYFMFVFFVCLVLFYRFCLFVCIVWIWFCFRFIDSGLFIAFGLSDTHEKLWAKDCVAVVSWDAAPLW